MISEQGLRFDPKLQLLICEAHGFGIHPTPQAITRHLRGEGHWSRGKVLKEAVAALADLPLRSLDDLAKEYPPVETQPISTPISFLSVQLGWMCLPCKGHYLTTSIELVQRHAAKEHGRRRGDDPSWTECRLQTFFQETKDRRYFRVKDNTTLSSSCVDGVQRRASGSANLAQLRVRFPARRDVDRFAISRWIRTKPQVSLEIVHPLALLAQEHISGFSIEYFDSLFKSPSFTAASEPLFDPSHVDSATNMQAVFPACDCDPLFYHALVYSMSQSSSRGEPTVQGAALEKAIVHLFNSEQAKSAAEISQATIGAIMLLKTTAYKLEDGLAHEIHSRGLQAALASYRPDRLTASARRALFWQEVYAAVFLDCDLVVERAQIFDDVRWARETSCNEEAPSLPAGFSRHKGLLPAELLNVIVDFQEMKAYLPILAQLPWHMRYLHLDSMQASIETRVVRLKKDCTSIGPLAESVRLAVFLCCYCAWTEIWDDRFIPCKLAERLLDVLEPTLPIDEWSLTCWADRLDLLLWLAYVFSNVIELDEGRVARLKSRRKQLLDRIDGMMSTLEASDTTFAWNGALTDFMYCEGWSAEVLKSRKDRM